MKRTQKMSGMDGFCRQPTGSQRLGGWALRLKLALVLVLVGSASAARAEDAPEAVPLAAVEPAAPVSAPIDAAPVAIEASDVPAIATPSSPQAVVASAEGAPASSTLGRGPAKSGSFGLGLALGNLTTLSNFVPTFELYPRLGLSGKYYYNEHLASQFQLSRGAVGKIGSSNRYFSTGTSLLLEGQLFKVGSQSVRGNLGAGLLAWWVTHESQVMLNVPFLVGISIPLETIPVELFVNFGFTKTLGWVSSEGFEAKFLELGDFYRTTGIGARYYF
ncbi:MAG: hypothetical protein ACKO6N_19630 [Myxococcota bacterium]